MLLEVWNFVKSSDSKFAEAMVLSGKSLGGRKAIHGESGDLCRAAYGFA